VRTFNGCGKLSKRKIDDLMSGARIAVGEHKEDPLDFALWKGAKPNEPGWDSPWGRGRPGWHIECSAMSMKYLGETLDFHGGGEDLIFPHHENELAQSEAATGVSFVQFWLHNGLLNLKGEKMSKSTGHFFAMEDVLNEFDGSIVRFYFLFSHFRKPSEYSRDRLEEAGRSYERLRLACLSIEENLRKIGDKPGITGPAGAALKEAIDKANDGFFAAMDDDFNSAGALGCVFDLIKTYRKLVDEKGAAITQDRDALEALKEVIVTYDHVLGIFPDGFPTDAGTVTDEITALVEARQQARKDRNFTKADEIRDKLDSMGYVIEDTPEGARVRKK
jgi:cysteinyl-tRNA synthetase